MATKRSKASKEEAIKQAVAVFETDFQAAYKKYATAIEGHETEAAVLLSAMLNKAMATKCVELTNSVSVKVIEELSPKIQATGERYLAAYTEANLTAMFESLLQPQIEDIALSILGLEKDHWSNGKWKVDHCNGRMSALSSLITNQVNTLVASLIEEEIVKWFNGPNKKAYIDKLRKSIESEIKDKIHSGTYKNVTCVAENITNNLFSTALANVLSNKCINGGTSKKSE